MIVFPELKKIAVVATASVSPESEVRQLPQVFSELFAVEMVMGQECYTPPQTAKEKAEKFLAYCLDDTVSHLWSCRGGEGSADIIPYLVQALPKLKKAKPKMLIGFSDFTAILVFFAQSLGWSAVHGMGALQFVRRSPDTQSIQKTLDLVRLGEYLGKIEHESLTALNFPAEEYLRGKIGVISGKLTGGNLTLLDISIKDQWEIDTQDKIVFLEDWYEKGYQVSRTLKYLKRIGKLENIKALILGDFAAGKFFEDPIENKSQQEILMRALKKFAEDLSIPVFHTLRIGHGLANDPLVLEHLLTL